MLHQANGVFDFQAGSDGITLLPMEKSWHWFSPVKGICGTLTARSKLMVTCTEGSIPVLRPLLPSELFGLQGMCLDDLFPHMPDPESELARAFTFNDMRRMSGMAFHQPSCMSAFLAAFLSVQR